MAKFIIKTNCHFHSVETVEIREWLTNNIGESLVDWGTLYDLANGKLKIKVYKEEHAVLVTLRWG